MEAVEYSVCPLEFCSLLSLLCSYSAQLSGWDGSSGSLSGIPLLSAAGKDEAATLR